VRIDPRHDGKGRRPNVAGPFAGSQATVKRLPQELAELPVRAASMVRASPSTSPVGVVAPAHARCRERLTA